MNRAYFVIGGGSFTATIIAIAIFWPWRSSSVNDASISGELDDLPIVAESSQPDVSEQPHNFGKDSLATQEKPESVNRPEVTFGDPFRKELDYRLSIALNDLGSDFYISAKEREAIFEVIEDATRRKIEIQSELARIISADSFSSSVQIAVPAYPDRGGEIKGFIELRLREVLGERYRDFDLKLSGFFENLFTDYGARDQIFTIDSVPGEQGLLKVGREVVWSLENNPENSIVAGSRYMGKSAEALVHSESLIDGEYQFLYSSFLRAFSERP